MRLLSGAAGGYGPRQLLCEVKHTGYRCSHSAMKRHRIPTMNVPISSQNSCHVVLPRLFAVFRIPASSEFCWPASLHLAMRAVILKSRRRVTVATQPAMSETSSNVTPVKNKNRSSPAMRRLAVLIHPNASPNAAVARPTNRLIAKDSCSIERACQRDDAVSPGSGDCSSSILLQWLHSIFGKVIVSALTLYSPTRPSLRRTDSKLEPAPFTFREVPL
jgi:hypothetical protein